MSDDFIIDDLFGPKPPKKPNSGRIGKTGERELAKIFSERFSNHPPFSRCLASGARWSQVKLSKESHNLMVSDLVCPTNFKFAIECKFGYDDIELFQTIAEGNSQLDKFLTQSSDSAKRAERIPLTCWRKKRKPWLVFLPSSELKSLTVNYLVYGEWTAISLKELLKLPDDFFFKA